MVNRYVKRRFSEDEMNRGIVMLEAVRSQRHIANVLGVSQSQDVEPIPNDWKCFAGPRQGERSTTPAQDRFIVLQARRRYDLT